MAVEEEIQSSRQSSLLTAGLNSRAHSESFEAEGLRASLAMAGILECGDSLALRGWGVALVLILATLLQDNGVVLSVRRTSANVRPET